MFHTRTATYINMNPFTGIPMSLICVLETFKFLQAFIQFSCLVMFTLFLHVSHMLTATYRNMNLFMGFPVFLICVSYLSIRNIEVFL